MEKHLHNQQGPEKKGLEIIINGHKHTWPHQYITGAQVRELGQIDEDDEIYLDIEKPWDDEVITDATKIDLARPGIEQFFSKKPVVIILINGTPHEWLEKKISFIEVIKLAFGVYHDNPNWIYTVGYEDGPKKNPEGSMIKDQEVFVKNKMIFHAKATDQS